MTPKRRIIPVFVPHLGCPNDCVFCNQRRISGERRPASAENVREAIQYAKDHILNGEKAELAFYGGSFTAIPAPQQEELLGAAFPFLEEGTLSSIRLSTRPDCIDKAVLARLKKYGVTTIELGVQSMMEDVLACSNRGHTPEDAVRAATLIRNAGFTLILQMMTGLPGDTREKSVETAKRLAALCPDGVRIYPTVILQDTRLYELWKAGDYREHTVLDAVEICADLLDVFSEAGIPVIRLGLNPTDELSGGGAVGGAYHPAFGELVYGERYYRKMCALLELLPGARNVVFGIPRGKLSMAVGQKRKNICRLKEKYGLFDIQMRENPEGSSDIVILEVEKE